MSEWYKLTKEDLSTSDGELHIYLTKNDEGNVYAYIKLEDIQEFLQDNNK